MMPFGEVGAQQGEVAVAPALSQQSCNRFLVSYNKHWLCKIVEMEVCCSYVQPKKKKQEVAHNTLSPYALEVLSILVYHLEWKYQAPENDQVISVNCCFKRNVIYMFDRVLESVRL